MAPYDELIDFVTEQNGIPRSEAETAVRRCAFAMAKSGAAAYLAGGIAVTYFLRMNPETAIPFAIVSTGAGAGYALTKSDQCSEVRNAIRFWNTAVF